MKALGLLSICAVGLTGCGAMNGSGMGSCSAVESFGAGPAIATANHSAAPPGNQQQFTARIGEETVNSAGQVCAVANVIAIAHPSWSNPDPLDIQISSANDATNGTAICLNATNGAVSLTATNVSVSTPQSITVQLTCQ